VSPTLEYRPASKGSINATPVKTGFRLSAALCAMLLLALFNGWVSVSHPLSDAPTANLDTGEVRRAEAAFKEADADPKILFMGSSLVLASMTQAESNFLAKPIARMVHRRNYFTEQLLSDFSARPRAYCMAIGGSMSSDDYLLLKNVILPAHKPDALVIGVAPRDFQDNLMPSVPSTETFRSQANMFDAVEYFSRKRRINSNELIEVALGRLCAFYNYRTDIRDYMVLRIKKTMQACMPWVAFYRYDEHGVLRPTRHGQFPEEVKGTPMILPNESMPHMPVQTTLENYRLRYAPINSQQNAQQFSYFERLLKLCRERQIKVVVVNMPLSRANLALVPDGFYAYYKQRVTEACQSYDVELVDMCIEPYTRDGMFADGVHLATGVSQQFLRSLCRRLHSSQVATSFSKSI